MIVFYLNDQKINTADPPGMTILDFVRYHRNLRGTKIGCREGDCGACTVLVGALREGRLHYQTMTSCLMPLGNAAGKHILTVEGLNMEQLSPVQKAIVEEGGTQCGICTVGFVVSLTAFVLHPEAGKREEAVAAIDGNICRCTGYKSLERAAARIAEELPDAGEENRLSHLVDKGYLPSYFNGIKNRLKELETQEEEIAQANGSPVIVGGGTDLFVQRPEEMLHAGSTYYFDRHHLKRIFREKGHCFLGASVTATDMVNSPLLQEVFSGLKEYVKLISSTPIRNMGTLAGNIVNASPIGDLSIFFLALDSSLIIRQGEKNRDVKLRDFFLEYKTLDLKPGEHLSALYFRIPEKSVFFNFEKVSKRTHLDIAGVNSACMLKVENGRISEAHLSAGGVAPVPKYLAKASAALIGTTPDHESLKKVSQIIQEEISPISDARGSADYKRLLLRQLFYAHFLTFFPKKLILEKLVN